MPAGTHVGIVCSDPRAPGLLVDLLSRERDPAAGAVLIGGIDGRERPLSEHRALVLGADRAAALIGGTLDEELRRAAPEAGERRLRDALAVAAAKNVLGADGLARQVLERGRALSGGERQRIALARALLAEPAVLVLDEPTGAVDAATEQLIAAQLREARRGRTTIVLSRSASLLAAQDEVALIAGGVVVASGAHRELLPDRGYRETIGA